MKTSLKAMCVCASSLIFLGVLHGEQTGEIWGKITEQKGEALPGVAITARSLKLQGIRTALSDHAGVFRLPLLPVGTYSLTYELPGFEKLTTVGNEVHLGTTLNVSVVLKISTVSEEVVVTAANPLIDKTKTDNSYRLTGEDLARVPSQARTIAEVVSFTPGVVGVRTNTSTGGAVIMLQGTEAGLPSFRGEGDAGNNWLIDGLSIKGARFNTPGVQVNYDAWEEVQIISDGFTPDMGQSLGGFVNIVTKSGGNEFHGELGSLARDRRLRAERKDQLSVGNLPATSLSHYFGNLGGAFLKDKLWFFLSDNVSRSFDSTKEQTINWLTIPAGERRYYTNNFFGKITFAPRVNHTLSLSGTLDKFLNQTGGIGPPETYERTSYIDYSYRINYRGILSQQTLVTAAWGQYKQDWRLEPLDGDYSAPGYYWLDVGQTTNNSQVGLNNITRRSDLTIALTQYLDTGAWGRHEIGVGLLYYKNSFKGIMQPTGLGFDPFPGNGFDEGGLIYWGSPGVPLMLWEWAAGASYNATKGFGFHAQDNIKIGRLSLMLGLRTETQKVYNDAGEAIWSWGLDDFLMPRASLAVDILGDGKNVLKFSYGQFVNSHSNQYLWIFNRKRPYGIRTYNWVGDDHPTAGELEDPLKWAFVYEQSQTAVPADVDSRLKPNRASKLLLEFDRQIGAHWALKLRGVYSRSKNLTDDVAFYDSEDQTVKSVYTNFDLKRRNYRALELELNGRVAGKYHLSVSYAWSRAKGTSSGNFVELGTWSGLMGDVYEGGAFGNHPLVPEGEPGKEQIDQLFQGLGGEGIGDEGWYGVLPYSVDHVIKILGTYYAPGGFVVSSGIEYLSGYHWEKKGWSSGYAGFATFPEGRGGRTTPPHLYIDLAVDKDIPLRKGLSLSVGMNVYNLLNSQEPVSFMKEDNEQFGKVWARQLPRWIQFKAILRF